MRRAVLVKVDVHVRRTIVVVPVDVNGRPPAYASQHRAGPEADDHQGDSKLEPPGNRVGNRDLEREHNQADGDERNRVTDAPQRSDHRSTVELPVFTDDRRNGNHVVGLRCVLEAEDETEAENADGADPNERRFVAVREDRGECRTDVDSGVDHGGPADGRAERRDDGGARNRQNSG